MPYGRTLRMCLIHRQLSKSMINHLKSKIRITINDVICPTFQYADPVADLLDKWDVFASRLFRESCVFHRGNYVKDLSRLGRELHKIIIVDNSPASYVFHPDNAVSSFSAQKLFKIVTLILISRYPVHRGSTIWRTENSLNSYLSLKNSVK